VYDTEQTRELRGISKATGVEMYLMVAFNVLLDLFMGCTSGGVRITENGVEKMVHFRTLDWGMDVLRRVVVQLDFVEKEGGPVVARSITYVGFVGILTGVRFVMDLLTMTSSCTNIKIGKTSVYHSTSAAYTTMQILQCQISCTLNTCSPSC
jgi:hypothetical protein